MKTKLTPELQEKIIKYIKAGSYIETACNAVGIDRQTLWQWIQKGERAIKLEKKGEKLSEKQENYRNFRNAIKKAKAGRGLLHVLHGYKKATQVTLFSKKG